VRLLEGLDNLAALDVTGRQPAARTASLEEHEAIPLPAPYGRYELYDDRKHPAVIE
jgi:hypothetical protein